MKNIFNYDNIKKVYNIINTYKTCNNYNKEEYDLFLLTRYLVNSGLFKYNKLTEENYNYWWYEVEKGSYEKYNNKIFTFNMKDIEKTRKGILFECFFLNNENMKKININDFCFFYDCLTDGRLKECKTMLDNYTINKINNNYYQQLSLF